MTFPSTITIFNWHRNLALDAQVSSGESDLQQAATTQYLVAEDCKGAAEFSIGPKRIRGPCCPWRLIATMD
jgi:hypothetical protein